MPPTEFTLKPRKPRVQSVARAVDILTAVARSAGGLRAPEIVAATGLPKQATQHLVHTLVTMGMLTKNERDAYVLGLRNGIFAEAFRRHLGPPEYLSPLIRRIASETGETAYASGWFDEEIVMMSAARGGNAVQAQEVLHGTYGDAHARASGKVLLAFADEPRRSEYLSAHPLSARTLHTIVQLPKLYAELELVRAQGYARDLEEFSLGLSCVAVPIDGGAAPYALTVSAPSDRFRERWTQYLAIMNATIGDVMGRRLRLAVA
ncbi:MAG: IclR family transcriptional regulator [Tagaea sp.]|nr:IclR family transcriptional regulator [Tagaea sp.]